MKLSIPINFSKWKTQIEDNLVLVLMFLAGIIITGYIELSGYSDEAKSSKSHSEIFTLIPQGYVLVPLEIQNSQALKSLVENYCYVQIFLPSRFGEGRLLARGVRLLRAPLDPNVFAALIPSRYSKYFVKIGKPLFIVLDSDPQEIEKFYISSHKVKRQITIEEGI